MAREGTPGYIREEDNQVGTIKWYNTTKGYGFITPDDGNGDIFLHRNHASFDPEIGDRVTYSIAEDQRRKRVYAVEVNLV